MTGGKYRVLLLILILVIAGTMTVIAGDFSYYRVEKGDTLTAIAGEFNVEIEELIRLNELEDPDLLSVGQLLKIPALKYKYYTIKAGDTLGKIAQKFGISIAKLQELNNIENPDLIITGEKLVVSDGQNNRRSLTAARGNRQNFIWPISGIISANYGWRIHPVTGRREFHHGIDIASPMGSPVYAAAGGVVTFTGSTKGYGKLVIIQHRGEYRTLYAHNLKLIVDEGDRVKKGKIISLSGNSGTSTGPHLHFEIKYNNRTTDPLQYLDKNYLRNSKQI